MISKFFLLIQILYFPTSLLAGFKVVTTTTNAKALVQEIAGEHGDVESLTKGSQDPHYLDAKPSFVMKLARADLLVSIGLDLEVGWLPAILSGARNPDLAEGKKGSLILGQHITPIEVAKGTVSRDQGDVHPDGNPHFLLDPIKAAELGFVIAERLGQFMPDKQQYFLKRAQAFDHRSRQLVREWQEQLKKLGMSELITYHKTLSYFLKRMNLSAVAFIEPKPGVPPTASHIVSLIQLVKSKNIPLVLIENYFDDSPAQRIKKDVPSLRIETVPVSVDGEDGLDTLDKLYHRIAAAMTADPAGASHEP